MDEQARLGATPVTGGRTVAEVGNAVAEAWLAHVASGRNAADVPGLHATWGRINAGLSRRDMDLVAAWYEAEYGSRADFHLPMYG